MFGDLGVLELGFCFSGFEKLLLPVKNALREFFNCFMLKDLLPGWLVCLFRLFSVKSSKP